jgi:enoyl-CoA hydratase/carnithine racemase
VPAVEHSIAGPVCRIRLSRPEKLNPLNDEARRLLDAAFTAIRDDTSVRVVMIEGDGRAFSAGADLDVLPRGGAERERPDWASRRHRSGSWSRLLDLLESLPQVTVAKLHGHVVGGAVLLAVTCDLRIAADDVLIRIPELALGIPLTWGGVPRLVREIGLPLTRDLVLTGRVMDGVEAQQCGFVQRLVARANLGAATDALIEQLLAMPPGPMAITRAMLAAIGKDRAGPAGWADPDLLMWSTTEPESRAAADDYLGARRAPRSTS